MICAVLLAAVCGGNRKTWRAPFRPFRLEEIKSLAAGTFCFRANMAYYGDLMYVCGLDRGGGALENGGRCLAYPKELTGTEKERKLVTVLEQAAECFREEGTT